MAGACGLLPLSTTCVRGVGLADGACIGMRGDTGGAHLLHTVQPTRGAGLGRRGPSAVENEALDMCVLQGRAYRSHVQALARIAHFPTIMHQVVSLLCTQSLRPPLQKGLEMVSSRAPLWAQ